MKHEQVIYSNAENAVMRTCTGHYVSTKGGGTVINGFPKESIHEPHLQREVKIIHIKKWKVSKEWLAEVR